MSLIARRKIEEMRAALNHLEAELNAADGPERPPGQREFDDPPDQHLSEARNTTDPPRPAGTGLGHVASRVKILEEQMAAMQTSLPQILGEVTKMRMQQLGSDE